MLTTWFRQRIGLYMIHRRLGDKAAAQACLDRIEPEMDVIENMNYHKCCLFYKGLISIEETAGRDSRRSRGGFDQLCNRQLVSVQ